MEKHNRREVNPTVDQIVNAITEEGQGFIFSGGRGLTRSERRRAKNLHAIEWVRGVGIEHVVWTPRQQAAVFLFYSLGIPEARCARALRIKRQSFADRLEGAERAAWRAFDKNPRERAKIGRPGSDTDVLDGTDPLRQYKPWLGEREVDRTYGDEWERLNPPDVDPEEWKESFDQLVSEATEP